jgi:3-phenylpropionate/cinnamic acid dioxygenase small subunit
MTGVGLDEALVIQLLVGYADALDRRRWDRLSHLFISEATAEWDLATHRSHAGRDVIVSFVRGSFDRFDRTQHLLSNYRVTVTGDSAKVTCRARNYHALADPALNQSIEVLGEYRMRAMRVGGEWQIAHLELEAFETLTGRRDQRPVPTGTGRALSSEALHDRRAQ